MFCEVTVTKLVVKFLKNHLCHFLPRRMQQLFLNKINIWWSCSTLLICFVWSYKTYITLRIVKNSSDCFGDQICFFFILNIEKVKATVHKQNHYLPQTYFFSGFTRVLFGSNSRATDPPTTDLTTPWINNHIWKTWQ